MHELPILEQHGTVEGNRRLMTKDTGQRNEATDHAQNKQSGRLPEETHGFRVLGIIACFISTVFLLMLGVRLLMLCWDFDRRCGCSRSLSKGQFANFSYLFVFRWIKIF